jgi:hypothetical protein
MEVTLLTWKSDACVHVDRKEDGLKLSLAAVHLSRSTRTLLMVLHVALLTRPASEAVDIFLRLQRGEGVDGEQCARSSALPSSTGGRIRDERGSGKGSRERARLRLRDEYGDESLSSVSDDLSRIISGCKVAKEIPSLQPQSQPQQSSFTSAGARHAEERRACACDVAVDLLLRQWVEEFVSERMWRHVLDQPSAGSDSSLDPSDGNGGDVADCTHHDLSDDFADAQETNGDGDSCGGGSSATPSFLAVLCELCQLFFKMHMRMVDYSPTFGAGEGISREKDGTNKKIGAIGGATGGAGSPYDEGTEEGKADENRLVEAEEDEQAGGSEKGVQPMKQEEGDDLQTLRVHRDEGATVTVMSDDPDCCYELLTGEKGGAGVVAVCELLLGLMTHFLGVYAEVKCGVSDDVDVSPLGHAEDVFWLGDVAWNMVSDP